MIRIAPLKLVSKHGIKSPRTAFVTLQRGKRRVNVPLKTSNGNLQGVFATPRGELIEVRHTPSGTKENGNQVYKETTAYSIKKRKRVAHGSGGMFHFFVDPSYSGVGIGKEVFNVGARGLVTRKGTNEVTVQTPHKDTAVFLRREGWKGVSARDRTILRGLKGKQERGAIIPAKNEWNSVIKLSKNFEYSKYLDPAKYHLIEVVNDKGKRMRVAIPVAKD